MPRLPTSQDVTPVSPRIQSDPGVQAPRQAFDSSVGSATKEFSTAMDQLALAAKRQEDRRDTVDRAKRINALKLDGDREYRRIDTEGDWSDESTLSSFGTFLSERRKKALEEHGGSEDSRAALDIRLQDIDSDLIGRAAARATEIGNKNILTAFEGSIKPMVVSASQNPTLENINRLYTDLETHMGDFRSASDPGMSAFGANEDVVRRAARQEIALGAIDNLIIRNRSETAMSLLESGNLKQELAPEKLRDTLRRIENVRVAKEDALQKVTTKPVYNIETKQRQFATEQEIARNKNLVPVGENESITTKPVFNTETGRHQFANEREIASNKNLVPVIEGKDTEIKPSQRLAAGYAFRMNQAGVVMDEIGEKFASSGSRAGGFLPAEIQTEDRKRFDQAKTNFINAQLRRESGATIQPSEMKSAEQQYFPSPGDTPMVLSQKKQNRIAVQKAAELEAGRAFSELKESLPSLFVKIKGESVLVGTIITNGKGQKGRVEQDGSIRVLK